MRKTASPHKSCSNDRAQSVVKRACCGQCAIELVSGRVPGTWGARTRVCLAHACACARTRACNCTQ
eukprot:6703737-Alexandrium_andersonii.AAC.1